MRAVRRGGAQVLRSRHVFVHLPRHLDAVAYRSAHEAGLEPDSSPYGFHHAEEFGYRVAFAGAAPTGTILERVSRKLVGFDLVNTWRNRRAIAEADIVWTMLEDEILGAAALMWLRLVPHRPIVGSTVWVVNDWGTFPPWRRWLYRALLGRAECLFVHSAPCCPVLRAAVPDARVELLRFGVAEEFLAIDDLRSSADQSGRIGPMRIVSAGNDRTRDWATLLAAFGGDPRFEVHIACPWLADEVVADLRNVSIHRALSSDGLRDLYRSADVLVVPMIDNLYSGITVALEAAACGVPLVAARTGGVPTYFDDDEVTYVDVGDPDALRQAVLDSSPADRRTRAERARRRFLVDDYTSRGMMRRYIGFTEASLARPERAVR